jgi:hypothetical protein
MRCWSCGKTIPDDAKMCPNCEVPVEEEPTADELEAVEGLLSQMPADVRSQIQDALERSSTAEEFANRLMVGDCPGCGSSDTGDCENDLDVNDICVGRCFQCGQLWCLDCGETFAKGQVRCSRADQHEAEYDEAFRAVDESRPKPKKKRKKKGKAAKQESVSPIAGRWRITEMEEYDSDFLDAGGSAFLKFGRNNAGDMRFTMVQAMIDYRLTERDGKPAVEWSWEGDDEGDPASGRGWAVLEPDGTLVGRIFMHYGEESGFVARKARKST